VDVSEPIGDVFVVLAGIVDKTGSRNALLVVIKWDRSTASFPLKTEIPLSRSCVCREMTGDE